MNLQYRSKGVGKLSPSVLVESLLKEEMWKLIYGSDCCSMGLYEGQSEPAGTY